MLNVRVAKENVANLVLKVALIPVSKLAILVDAPLANSLSNQGMLVCPCHTAFHSLRPQTTLSLAWIFMHRVLAGRNIPAADNVMLVTDLCYFMLALYI